MVPTLSDPLGPDSQSNGIVFPATRPFRRSNSSRFPRRLIIEPIEMNFGMPKIIPVGRSCRVGLPHPRRDRLPKNRSGSVTTRRTLRVGQVRVNLRCSRSRCRPVRVPGRGR
ncbi:hypothetical protein DDW44_06715 [Streptomyces tirandamycinicus]|uniref:Uncharacterized protein n=1 Tax=Streptomyces tirandamycinicus TaxID=2174846 RepID=A0A2S1SQ35_9ACTN|nr:hypothetical protein DDW44_06715 [Streptomyces tirandamycinicus]